MKYRKGYRYQLAEDYSTRIEIVPERTIDTEYVTLSLQGILFIRNGYAWDGASGPTIDCKSSMTASLVHDALYQLMRMTELMPRHRHTADTIVHRMCVAGGMNKIRAWIYFKAVSLVGAKFILPSRKKKILVA